MGAGAGLAPSALDGLGSAATAGAPAARGSHPVLLMSPGLGATTAFMGAHAADLASHGYVVVGIDVPGETAGRRPRRRRPRRRWCPASRRRRSRRSRCARATCASCSRGSARCAASAGSTSQRVGAFGHSNGGATAADRDARRPADPRRREPRRRDLRAGRRARPRPPVRHAARRRPGRRLRVDVRAALAPARAAPVRVLPPRRATTASPTSCGWFRSSASTRRRWRSGRSTPPPRSPRRPCC